MPRVTPLSRDLADALVEVIRERMEERSLSVNAMAVQIGIAQQTLARHFAGEGNIPLDEFDSLAQALDEPLEDLLIAARRRV